MLVSAQSNYAILLAEETNNHPYNFTEGLPQYVTLYDDQGNNLT